MKTFSEYSEYDSDILMESIGIIDGKLVFDYNKIKPDSGEASSKLGKKYKGAKFVPYETGVKTIIKHKVYSVYSNEKYNVTDILKAIKRKSNVVVDTDEYKQFINRTAIYIDYKLIRKNNIDVLITPSSSSTILTDLLDNLSKRNPKLTIINKAFTKSVPDKVKIDKNHSKITPKIINILSKILDTSKSKGYFEMKKVPVKFRKFIFHFMEINPDISLQNNVNNNNVAIIDDVIASGNTMKDMLKYLELYSPNKLIDITLFK